MRIERRQQRRLVESEEGDLWCLLCSVGAFGPLWVNDRPNYMLKNVYFWYLDVTRSPTGRTIIDVWDVQTSYH